MFANTPSVASPSLSSSTPRRLILSGVKVEGSLIGGCPLTQEMLDFCGKHNITPDIDLITANEASEAFRKLSQGATSKRFVIDMSTLKDLKDYQPRADFKPTATAGAAEEKKD